MKLLLIVGIVIQLPVLAVWSPVSSNSIPWSYSVAGVPGGIPYRTNIYTTITAGNMTVGNINSALSSCPSNQVIQLATGTYSFSSRITVPANHPGVTLRGGPTKITGSGSFDINFGPQIFPWWTVTANLTSGYTKGSSNVVLTTPGDITKFAPGQLIMIDGLDDTNLVWDKSGHGRELCSEAVVTITNSTSVTYWPPLPYGYVSGQSPQIHSQSTPDVMAFYQINSVGIEDITIDMTARASTAITCSDLYGCWLKNVMITNCDGYTINAFDCSRCTFSRLDLRYAPTGAANHAGINFVGRVGGSVVEDSIFVKMNNAISIGDGGEAGNSGNIFGYNFIHDSYQDGFGQYNGLWANHHAHNIMNLWEGNHANGVISDGYFGSSSHNIVFRNYLHGWTPTYPTSNSGAVLLKRWSLYWEIVNNVLARTGVQYYNNTNNGYSDNGVVYEFGFPNSGNHIYTGTRPPNAPVNPGDDQALDLNVQPSTLLHGNYDFYSNATHYAVGLDTNFPSSLYLTSKPTWLGNLVYPLIGPDVSLVESATNSAVTNITNPARERFYGRDVGTNSGSTGPYYVATNGNNANDGVTTSTPWTLTKGLTNLGPDITVIMLPGTYPGDATIAAAASGTAGHLATLQSQSKWSAVIANGTNWNLACSFTPFVHDVVIDGIVSSNCTAGDGIGLAANNCTIKNCWIVNNNQQGINASHASSSNNIIDSNLIEGNGAAGGTTNLHFHGIYLSGPNNIARNNVIRRDYGFGLQYYTGFTNTIQDNTAIYNNLIYGHTNIYGLTVWGTDGGLTLSGTNQVINNTILDGASVYYGTARFTNNIIVPSVIFTNNGIAVGSGPPTITADYNMSTVAFASPGAHDVITNYMGFASTNAGLYWLAADSPARTKAIAETLAVDFFSVPTPTITDIGFVQYTSALAGDGRTLDPSGSNPDYWGTPTTNSVTFTRSTPGLRARRGR